MRCIKVFPSDDPVWSYRMKQPTMQYNGYHGSVEVSVEDNVLHGSIQFINDLVTYEAETPEKLRHEFEAAVDDYLETLHQTARRTGLKI